MAIIPTQIKYYIVVEGKTEEQYFKRLNQLDEIKTSPLRFDPYQAGNCSSKVVLRKYNEILRTHNVRKPAPGWNDVKMIVLDRDVFCRGKERADRFPPNILYFSVFNFEDFLVQHLESDKVVQWNSICLRQNHFKEPMVENHYMEHIQTIFPNYSKGALPFDLDISHLQRLKDNLNRKCFNPPTAERKNDFSQWFVNLLTNHKIIS